MRVERGFKSYAEKLALELRKEMGLAPHGRLCAFALAEHLEVPVLPFSRFSTALPPAQLKALHEEVHGITIPWEPGRAVLYNDRNAPSRQQSDVAHELSHIILQHPMTAIGPGAKRVRRLEDEAAVLSGALLVPRSAAVYALRLGLAPAQAAEMLGVSEQMFTYRANVTAAWRAARV